MQSIVKFNANFVKLSPKNEFSALRHEKLHPSNTPISDA